jgi:hypothetical protein
MKLDPINAPIQISVFSSLQSLKRDKYRRGGNFQVLALWPLFLYYVQALTLFYPRPLQEDKMGAVSKIF